MNFGNEFEKYATGHLGVNSHTLSDYTSEINRFNPKNLTDRKSVV